MVDLIDRSIDHQCDEIVLVGLGDPPRANQRAVAQDRDAIAQFENFFQTVADVDDGDAIRLQPADQLEQRRRLLTREIGGRLVEDQEFGAAPLRARRGDQLLLADGERGQERARRKFEAEFVEQLLALAQHCPFVEQPASRGLVAQKDVRRYRQMRAEHDFLVDRVDAEADRLMRTDQRHGRALPANLARGARMDPSQELDQCRLAGAVLPDDGVNFAPFEREIDRLQRMRRAEAFVELLQDENRRSGDGSGRGRGGREGHGPFKPMVMDRNAG